MGRAGRSVICDLVSGGVGVVCPGVADGLAAHNHFDSTVLLTACRRAIGRDRIFLTETFRDHRIGRECLASAGSRERCQPALRKITVVFRGAGGVGVTIDANFQVGIRKQNARHPRKLLARSGLQSRLIHVEEHVGHIDDQALGAIARLQDLVQLRLQALP